METNPETLSTNTEVEEPVNAAGLQLPRLPDPVWNQQETQQPKKKQNKKWIRITSYVGLGLFSFFFFLYLTFPYGVLKEILAVQVTTAMQASGLPMRLSIGSAGPHWFTGMKFENVTLSNVADPSVNMRFAEASARVNVLPLLIGTVSVSGKVAQAGGATDFYVALPLFGLISGAPFPKRAEIDFKSFSIDGLFNHAIAMAKGSKNPSMALVLPLIEKSSAGGKISGTVRVSNSTPSDPSKAIGKVNLNLANAFLHINDETLKIPRQNFKEAKVELSYESGTASIQGIKFIAPDIGINLNGKIADSAMGAEADLNLKLSMHGSVRENLGSLVPLIMRCRELVNGELDAKLKGPVAGMNCI